MTAGRVACSTGAPEHLLSWGFPKIRDTSLGVSIKTIVLGSILAFPYFGKIPATVNISHIKEPLTVDIGVPLVVEFSPE